jgi:AcrR family transcriptional regulator
MTAGERREQIVQAARAEFAARGYHAATTDAIAARAGVSQPYVIRLFGTKRALFLAVADDCFRQVHDVFSEAAAGAPPGQELIMMGAAYRNLIADREVLALQLHFYAACAGDETLRRGGRERFENLMEHIRQLSGAPQSEVIRFNALGMLINVASALDLRLDLS